MNHLCRQDTTALTNEQYGMSSRSRYTCSSACRLPAELMPRPESALLTTLSMIELTAMTPLGAGEVRPATWPPGFRGVSSDCGARLCMVLPVYIASQPQPLPLQQDDNPMGTYF